MKTLKIILIGVSLLPAVAAASVEITDIQVENSVFSPNGDGLLDTTSASFDVVTDLGWAAVWVWVEDQDGGKIRDLAVDEAASSGVFERSWDGRTGQGAQAPEGTYHFKMFARAGSDSTQIFGASTVLDVTAPAFSALITPNPYTPDLPLADSLLSVRILVTGSQPDDWLSVTISTTEVPETLCARQLTLGDTTYECTWDGRAYDDGIYVLTVRTYDKAANESQASYAVDLDVRGPSLKITEPSGKTLDAFPDRVAGFAFDRSGLDSLGFRFLADSAYGPVLTETSGDTVYWQAPWPPELETDGTFTLGAYARDPAGHVTTVAGDIIVDTQAPPAPTLAGLPEVVNRPGLQVSGSCEAQDTVILYLNGGAVERFPCGATGTFSTEITLVEGPNSIYAEARDEAGNTSPPSETVTVTYVKEVGINVPEILKPGSVIDVTLARAADLVTARIYSFEGSYVTTLTKISPELVDDMAWDLKDSDGKYVRNGVYIMVFEVDYSDGGRKVEKKAAMVVR